jgi:large subunit ribosomal protein L15
MQLHQLQRKTKRQTSRQVGRGGTRGKTSGRGTKGQNARAGAKKRPELRDIIKKLPKLRGRGISTFKSLAGDSLIINLEAIEKNFKTGDVVTPKHLSAKKLVTQPTGKTLPIKVLGKGDITKKIILKGFTISAGAKTKIEAAGGSTIA